MLQISDKIKHYLKRAALFTSLFLVLSGLLVYLTNLDICSIKKTSLIEVPAQNITFDKDTQFKEKIGSTSINNAGFEQWAIINNLNGNNIYEADPDNDGFSNYLEYVFGTDPLKADTDNDGYSDKQEIVSGYDPDAAQGDPKLMVSLWIEKIRIKAPMIWSSSENEKNMLSDLENGVSHYAKTASPGQNGNMIISGHSSNYFWAKGDYNYIFKDLNDLEKGDVIMVDTFQKNGRIITYRYEIKDKFITAPDDQRIFAETSIPTLTLSTCWPIGTTFKRTIIKAELVK